MKVVWWELSATACQEHCWSAETALMDSIVEITATLAFLLLSVPSPRD
jgi:hypothetical protein